jgi:hypothetical protein
MERAHNLVRIAALPLAEQRFDPLDWARSAIVLGCALSLILAGQALPF